MQALTLGELFRRGRSLPGFGPIFERSAHDHPNIVYAKVDTNADPELAARDRHSIRSHHRGLPRRGAGSPPPGAMPLVVLRRLISHIKAIKRTRSRADLKRRVALGAR